MDNAGDWETVQSIEFDKNSKTVFGLSRLNESASIVRYESGNWEEWNLTELFNQRLFYMQIMCTGAVP